LRGVPGGDFNAEDFGAKGGHNSREGEAGVGASEDAAVVSGEPGFSDGLGSRSGIAGGRVPGREVSGPPGAGAEARSENKRRHRHEARIAARSG
jgi:hypothetical protein